jgi:hypothetical protein
MRTDLFIFAPLSVVAVLAVRGALLPRSKARAPICNGAIYAKAHDDRLLFEEEQSFLSQIIEG